MVYSDTVGENGEVSLPAPVRERLEVEAGDTVLFRFDGEAGVRLVGVPSDPMERLQVLRERTGDLELDVQELLDRERDEW